MGELRNYGTKELRNYGIYGTTEFTEYFCHAGIMARQNEGMENAFPKEFICKE